MRPFFTPAVVHTSYFDCVMKRNCIKGENGKYVRDVDHIL